MTSVWKRLQRVGKKASKFQFTALYQSLTVECVRGGKWQPNKLVVVWTRRKRRKVTKSMPWQPGISNPFRGIIVWPEPEPVDITVTLYKDPRPDSEFEDKEWTFVIEDESQTGRRKPIATGVINMVDYVSVENRTFDITLTMKVASKKLVSASLEFTLSCVLIKEGMATDDDMISIGSMMSLSDNYNLDDDDDMEVVPSPRLRHRRNLSSGNVKFSPVSVVRQQDLSDGKMRSLTASPVLGKKQQNRIRSKSALGENVKTIVSDVQKEDAAKRLSTGSDVSSEISDGGQEVSKDKSRMESELIKWVRSRTKGYKGVKVKNMTTCWRDGLAFCAVLHSFHPDKIDFSSLDPHNIKDNCKLAFSEFEKLGIPRLLDPTQMMFSPIPDKLSVMTYVFQIKTYFSKPPALPPSPLSINKPVQPSRPAPPPPKLVVSSVEDFEGPGDGNVNTDDTGKRKGKSEEAYNPFLDDTEDIEMESTPESSTEPSSMSSATNTSRGDEKELATESASASSKSKTISQENASKESDVGVNNVMKPPRKPPRLRQTSDSSGVDTKAKSNEYVDQKEANESKGYNPFDDDETEDIALNSATSPSKIKKPVAGYNPFDDDDEEVGPQGQNVSGKETEVGSNPFDDDDDDDEDVTKTEKVPDENVGKKVTRKKKMSYPHAFNPFEDNDDLKSSESGEGSQRTQTKGSKGDEVASSKGYNPFDDDNDDKKVTNNTSRVESSTRKSSLEKKDIVSQAAQAGRGSPSGLRKQPKRQAPPPPAARPSDDPWTARLPEEVMTRRRRTARSGSPGSSPQTSPAKSSPKRTAPAPPRRPPLIPTFDDWKNDRGVTGGNERPAATPSAENSPSKTISAGKDDGTQKTTAPPPEGSDSRSSQVPTGEGANQADIKLLARQVLMDARKKAGASGALPRQRVAEITKTSKGSGTSEGGTQEKDKTDDEETLKKKENLRQRKEELQRRRKATEKAQKMVQNAIEREKGQKLSSSSEQLKAEQQTQDISETTDASNDQKAVKNKNLQHRPLKLKDKENEPSNRRPSTEKEAKSPPDKSGFKESEELQRIRQILNQGKKEKKPSNSENLEEENGTVKAQSPEAAKESERKLSDSKSSKNKAVNGLSDSSTPTPPARAKTRGPNAGLHAYVESRKMNFEVFEVPSVRTQSDEHEEGEDEKDTSSDGVHKTDGQTETRDETSLELEDEESLDQTAEFQDTSEYVRQELKSLEEQQEALDKVGEKLETELRRAMECKGCEEEQEKLMQDWFLLVNKKNELVRRQAELNLLKNEEDLERSHDMLQRELRALLEMEDWQKTDEQRKREAELIKQLVLVVNKRDQLVQFEDSQLQQAEKDALHVQNVIASARIPRDKNECVLQ